MNLTWISSSFFFAGDIKTFLETEFQVPVSKMQLKGWKSADVSDSVSLLKIKTLIRLSIEINKGISYLKLWSQSVVNVANLFFRRRLRPLIQLNLSFILILIHLMPKML